LFFFVFWDVGTFGFWILDFEFGFWILRFYDFGVWDFMTFGFWIFVCQDFWILGFLVCLTFLIF